MALDPSIMTLHRYYIWANQMRVHFDEALKKKIEGDKEEDHFEIKSFLYMSYWYAASYVVIEGWKELKLSDVEVDNLLKSPNVDLLRRYRNGVFHYQKEYYGQKFGDFIEKGNFVVEWVRKLNSETGRYFLNYIKLNKG